MIDAVLFDMDGVLVDSFDAWVAVLDRCRERRGLAPLGSEGVKACWGQGLDADCRTLFPGESPEVLAAEYVSEFARHTGLVREIPGARQALEAVGNRGFKAAVVTNSPVGLARAVLGRLELDSKFDAICGADEVERGKPDPQLVELALSRLGIDRARAVLVGDTPLDTAAARSAGVSAVGLGTAGDARIESLKELIPLIDRRSPPPSR